MTSTPTKPPPLPIAKILLPLASVGVALLGWYLLKPWLCYLPSVLFALVRSWTNSRSGDMFEGPLATYQSQGMPITENKLRSIYLGVIFTLCVITTLLLFGAIKWFGHSFFTVLFSEAPVSLLIFLLRAKKA